MNEARRWPLLSISLGVTALLACTAFSLPQSESKRAADTEEALFFETNIRPLLAARCWRCHSERAHVTRGGLALDSRAGWTKGGASGPAVRPGDPDRSRLVQAVRQSGGAPGMPPDGRLSEKEIALLVEWTRRGAQAPADGVAPNAAQKARSHWAFQPLARPKIPPTRNAGFARTPIDRFLLAAMEKRGVAPNPPADRRTLLRRAYFDLTGMPPSPEDVRSFLADSGPNAFEKVVDRLLASPHYGERWGRYWLDLARYADSHGYEQDYDRPFAYTYRDFVIKALNADMPYDQFVRWQIAGDEFAPEDPMALAATGFLAAGTHATQITKSQVEKERYDELDDMLATTGTALLGLTLGCARCHDHKFDPVSRNEYYRMLSTFTTAVRSEMEVNMDPQGYQREREQFALAHRPLVEELERYERSVLPARMETWVKQDAARIAPAPWQVLEVKSAASAGGASFKELPDGSLLASGKLPAQDAYTIVAHTRLTGIRAVRLEALSDPSLVKGGPGRAANGNFALTGIQVTAAPRDGATPAAPVRLVRARADFEQSGLTIASALKGDARAGWAVDPRFGTDHFAAMEPEKPFGFAGGTVLTFTLKFENNTGHSIGRLRLSVTSAAELPPLQAPARSEQVERALATVRAGRDALSQEEHAAVQEFYRTQDPEWLMRYRRVQQHLAQEPKPPMQKMLVCSEGVPAVRNHTQGEDFLPQTYFLNRGDPNQKLGVAEQGFLNILMREPNSERLWTTRPPAGCRTTYRRRAMAAWMTDAGKGAGFLLARVIVNRVWQHHMGAGIVRTPSDFGTQGEPPTHPELLDWLASELIASGWRLKPIHRLILTSAAYRQSSALQPASTRIDPDNRLCWRRPRMRLEAEAIRDSLLAVSGLLDARQFGPGTLDESHLRRSIYFMQKRSRLIPFLTAFDAPNTLTGIAVRPVTTVAPQALKLMNDSQVRRYADAFARRAFPVPQTPPGDAVRNAFLLALSRLPTQREETEAVRFVLEEAASYRAANGTAGQSTGMEPAFRDFCQALLCLNEFIYID